MGGTAGMPRHAGVPWCCFARYYNEHAQHRISGLLRSCPAQQPALRLGEKKSPTHVRRRREQAGGGGADAQDGAEGTERDGDDGQGGRRRLRRQSQRKQQQRGRHGPLQAAGGVQAEGEGELRAQQEARDQPVGLRRLQERARAPGGGVVLRGLPLLPTRGRRKPGHLRTIHASRRLRELRGVGSGRVLRRPDPPHVDFDVFGVFGVFLRGGGVRVQR